LRHLAARLIAQFTDLSLLHGVRHRRSRDDSRDNTIQTHAHLERKLRFKALWQL